MANTRVSNGHYTEALFVLEMRLGFGGAEFATGGVQGGRQWLPWLEHNE